MNAKSPLTITQFVHGNGLLKKLAVLPHGSKTIISTSSFTSQGLSVTYDHTNVTVRTSTNTTLITGQRDSDGLWKLPLQQLLDHPGVMHPVDNESVSVLHAALQPSTIRDVVDYASLVLGRPPDSTLKMVLERGYIKNFFDGVILPKHVDQYPPNNIGTSLGTLKMVRKRTHASTSKSNHNSYNHPLSKNFDNRVSTSSRQASKSRRTRRLPRRLSTQDSDSSSNHSNSSNDEANDEVVHAFTDELESFPDSPAFVDTTELHILKVLDLDSPHEELKHDSLYLDSTGPYSATTKAGKKLVLIGILHGYIKPEPIKTTSAAELCRATENIVTFFLEHNQTMARTVLDNQCPHALKQKFNQRKLDYQLVERGNHRYNKAEKAVDIVKQRFITARSIADPDFKFDEQWDKLIPAIETAINLTLPSPQDKSKSTWETVHGKYDHHKHPLLPMAMKAAVYKPRKDRATSFSDHADIGYTLESSQEHYRGNHFFMPKTNSIVISASFAAHPREGFLPGRNYTERIVEAMHEIDVSLKQLIQKNQIDGPLAANIAQRLAMLRQPHLPLFDLESIPNNKNIRQTLDVEIHHPLSVSLNPDVISNSEINRQLHEKQKLQQQARDDLYSQQRASRVQPDPSVMITEVSPIPDHDIGEIDYYAYLLQEKLVILPDEDLATINREVFAIYQSSKFEDIDKSTQDTLIHIALAARKVHTSDTPSLSSVLKSPPLLATWMPAIKLELDGLVKSGALIPCQQSDTTRQELLPALIQLKRKFKGDGTVDKLKARACIAGNFEKERFQDPSELFSPNASFNTYLIFIAVSVRRNWVLRGTDIAMAYTMAPYTRNQPLYTYTELGGARQYYRVGKMLYGMADAAQGWYWTYIDLLLELGFTISIDDPCLLFKVKNDEDGIVVCVTTDDTAISHSDNAVGYSYVQELRDAMTARGWEHTFQPRLQDTLGMVMTTQPNKSLLITMPAKINKIQTVFFGNAELSTIPTVFNPRMSKWNLTASRESPRMDPTTFREGLGLFPYVANTRHDIRTSVSILSSVMQDPSELDYEFCKHIAAYLITTIAVGLCFHSSLSVNNNTATSLIGASDAAFDVYLDSKSQLGVIAKLQSLSDPGGCVYASSKKEKGVTSDSATVAEAKAALKGLKQLIVLRQQLEDMGRPQSEPTPFYQDNNGLIKTMTRFGACKEPLRHIRRLLNCLKSHNDQPKPTVNTQYIKSPQQPADHLTKFLTTIDNLRQLEFLQGKQQAIDDLIAKYNDIHRSKPIIIPPQSHTDEVYCVLCTTPSVFCIRQITPLVESLAERLQLADQFRRHNTTPSLKIKQLNANLSKIQDRKSFRIKWHHSV